jgi:membrane-bound metal-dependent hydrolase YbcI (DUF457 family)
MFALYFQRMDSYSLFLGYNLIDDPFFKTFGGNPHNSFIFMHSIIGFLFFPFIIFVFFRMKELFHTNKLFFIALAAVFFRAWNDRLIFITGMDYIILCYLVYKLKIVKY